MNNKKYEVKDEIDNIVFSFQDGDEDAAETLMLLFGCHPSQKEPTLLVGKYFRLLRKEIIDFKDKVMCRMFYNFIDNQEIRKSLMHQKTKGFAKVEAQQVARRLAIEFSRIPDEDLLQDLREIFLNKALKYKKVKKDVDFSGYIQKAFMFGLVNYHRRHFVVKNNIYLKAPGIIKSHENDLLEDPNLFDMDKEIIQSRQPDRFGKDEEIGFNWVCGFYCGDEFEMLTMFERRIIKMKFFDNIPYVEIAKRTGYHRNTISTIANHAIEDIRVTGEMIHSLKEDDVQ